MFYRMIGREFRHTQRGKCISQDSLVRSQEGSYQPSWGCLRLLQEEKGYTIDGIQNGAQVFLGLAVVILFRNRNSLFEFFGLFDQNLLPF